MRNYEKISQSSIIISFIIIIVKLFFDIKSYLFFSDVFANSEGDLSPTVVAGGMKMIFLLLIFPLMVSFALSIYGIIKKNDKRYLALILWIFTCIYIFIPVGMILASFII